MWFSRSGICLIFWLTVVFVLNTKSSWAQDSAEFLEQARNAYKNRHILANAKKSVDLYEKAIDAGAGYEALWEGARTCFYLGEFPMKNNSRRFRLDLYEKAIDWAKRAVGMRPNGVEGIFWHGSMIGTWAQARGILKSLSVSGEVRDLGVKSLHLNDRFECGGPYRLLGRYYHKLPRVFGGDLNKGIKLLQKAVEICPRNEVGQLYLAEALHDGDRNDEARVQLEKIIAGPPDPRWSAEHPYLVRQANALLNDL